MRLPDALTPQMVICFLQQGMGDNKAAAIKMNQIFNDVGPSLKRALSIVECQGGADVSSSGVKVPAVWTSPCGKSQLRCTLLLNQWLP